MKKLLLLLLVFCFALCMPIQAETTELRGVWVSTVANIDFPSKSGISVAQMKKEVDTTLDTVKKLGFNAIVLQTRPMGDAMYPSKIYPWSGFLTGKQGQAPASGFDPLKYWIDGAHKRGMQLHAWCNPYRVTHGRIPKADLAPNNPAVLHPDWTFEKDGKLFLNPGLPEVRELVISGLVEIVKNYDVDGVHFDDYFYPARNMEEDAETFKKYGKQFTNIEDWRRNNVDLLVKGIHDAVKKANPKAQWGISPAGIWANKGNDPGRAQHPEGSATRGNSTYYNLFADTKKWVKEGWIDYIVPQIYWHIGFEIADFKTLADWWADVCEGTKTKLYIGMAAYRVDPNSKTEAWKSVDELIRQLDYLKTKKRVDGFVMFTMKNLKEGTLVNQALKTYYGKTAAKSSKVNKSVYIYLSPSSQNANIGFDEYTSEEFRMNQVAQHLKKHLLEAGVKVLPELPPVTKKQLDDPNYERVSLRARLDESMRLAKELEKKEPDALFYHFALHTNAANKSARGAEIFIDPANPQSTAMAEAILAASVALYHKDNPDEAAKHGTNEKALKFCRGVKDTGRLIEAQSKNTKNGMLIEFCFHDEEIDSKWMLRNIAEGEKPNGVNPLAKTVSDAIVEFVNQQ
jgi:uncharacterized lipoprotein YddW (UPF0748 family)